MFAFRLMLVCIAIYDVIEGRTVQAIIGRNASFSFIVSNITNDVIYIYHDSSLFLTVWPAENFTSVHEDKENVQVSFDMSRSETTIVTIFILNITEENAGQYTLGQQIDTETFNDSIRLQALDNTAIPRIAIVRRIVSELSLVLQCCTDSSYAGIVLWKLNSSLIESIDRYSHNNEYLSIRNLTADDQYNSYTCWKENGFESDTYRLKTNGPSVVDFIPNKTAVLEHHSLNLSCISDCNPVCTYQWTQLDRLTGFERELSAESALYFNNITRKDDGKYMCKVKNVISDTSYTNILVLDVVYGPDEILLNASNAAIEMDEFDSIAIFCSADCFPPCQIHWSQSNNHMSGANLWLNNLQKDGNFTCHATNERNVNTSISKTISIIMKSGSGHSTSTSKDVGNATEANGIRIDRLLLYLVIGMGVLLITGFCVCILWTLVKSSRLDRVKDNIPFKESGEENPLQTNQSDEYWTIICNADGNLNTSLETNISQINVTRPITNISDAEMNALEASPSLQRMEVDMEFDGYIHAFHSDPVNTYFMPTCDTTDVQCNPDIFTEHGKLQNGD